MTTETDWTDAPAKRVKPLTPYEEGERDGAEARKAGTYTTEERARFINANRGDSDRYTQGFIAGLRT